MVAFLASKFPFHGAIDLSRAILRTTYTSNPTSSTCNGWKPPQSSRWMWKEKINLTSFLALPELKNNNRHENRISNRAACAPMHMYCVNTYTCTCCALVCSVVSLLLCLVLPRKREGSFTSPFLHAKSLSSIFIRSWGKPRKLGDMQLKK